MIAGSDPPRGPPGPQLYGSAHRTEGQHPQGHGEGGVGVAVMVVMMVLVVMMVMTVMVMMAVVVVTIAPPGERLQDRHPREGQRQGGQGGHHPPPPSHPPAHPHRPRTHLPFISRLHHL